MPISTDTHDAGLVSGVAPVTEAEFTASTVVRHLVPYALTMHRRREKITRGQPESTPISDKYRKTAAKKSSASSLFAIIIFCFTTLLLLLRTLDVDHMYSTKTKKNDRRTVHFLRNVSQSDLHLQATSFQKDNRTIHSLQDLSQSDLHPQATSSRYIISPPKDNLPITLVTCETTKGFLHIIVHPSWAPLGARRFLDMVSRKYFSSKIAMMRCLKHFLCQFGIAGDPSYNKEYRGTLKDDPNWLPEGPTHRTNEFGVKRFSKGFMAYAGGGKNSRSNQFIVALADNERLGGGSPWEVPWGEVVGVESFETLDKIFIGYGENGPSVRMKLLVN